jgi:hypothetical protein
MLHRVSVSAFLFLLTIATSSAYAKICMLLNPICPAVFNFCTIASRAKSLHLMLWFLYELWIPPLTLCLHTNACTIRPLYSMLWHPQVWKEHLLFLARGITQYHSKGVCTLVLHRFLRQVPFIFFGNAATHGPLRALSSKGTDCQQEFNCLAGLPAYIVYWNKWRKVWDNYCILHNTTNVMAEHVKISYICKPKLYTAYTVSFYLLSHI